MGKRAHGEGSISKRKDGRWRGVATVGYTPEGKQKRRTVYGKTQQEAREKLHALNQQLAQGTLSNTKLTVGAFLEQWLEEKERTIKATTLHEYQVCVRKYIVPRVGRERLDKLTPMRVQRLISEIADASKGKGVATANKCRIVLQSAYKQAIRWKLVSVNPVEAVDPLPTVKRDMKLWTPQEAARFLDTARPHRLYALFYLAMSTGMRRGELLGLRWGDVEGDTITIKQNLVKVGQTVKLQTPKTAKGYRRIPVTADVIDALEHHRALQRSEAALMGEAWHDSGLVFITETGEHLHPDTLKGHRNRLMDSAGVPRVKLHDLRHLHASIAIRNGTDPKVLADRLGHARASFTLDTYTHLFDEQRAKAAVSLMDFLPAPAEPN